ncbi:hypothetical protein B0A58_07600 [Flavobacterium branchiophilum NBRC 15030 = ATCC 35035]|uniref:YGGT family protein n=1 Tax=Flavobacterium branchiophilum TaxID=55197 RepID=A0A543G3A8_9FLAO|nr:YggT family protein [Flavobacterium branchiophilum]OXA76256.1 hypothetical protein B0A58_07600 [Flavobacterium branchiophilum NBRC 15030 = ATCC 35035]TQM40504.1 YGGT family protein [Flavobacterium branchiophilum]GEM55104.1 hypothetical protein FB1_13250 [Flavobacterium branchiophilum NBRC 15030 = ATCC 35035]
MRTLLHFFIIIVIVGLFLYNKLLPYKEKLNPQYKKVFSFFDAIFSPVFEILKSIFKPVQVGYGLFVDMTQVIVLLILLFLLHLF